MTDDPNARPSLSERYGVAVGNGAGMEHMILAAGMQHERLGAILLRLQSEYDAVRGDLERAGQIAPRGLDRARVLRQEAERLKKAERWLEAEALIVEAEAIQPRTKAQVKTAHAVILVALTALQGARQELGALAIRMAERRSRPKLLSPAGERLGAVHARTITNDVALRLAGRVLDVWLDETCHTCDGTGMVGNAYAGEVRRQCGTCCGSGHRRDIIGRNPTERIFARDLLAELQRRVAAAAGGMGQALAPPEAAEPDAAELRNLQGRLADMRAAAVQTD